jgi:hypothetical protein
VSASAIPEVKNNDSVSAASFFIASLFASNFENPTEKPVSMRTTPRQKVKGASYGYVNQM